MTGRQKEVHGQRQWDEKRKVGTEWEDTDRIQT